MNNSIIRPNTVVHCKTEQQAKDIRPNTVVHCKTEQQAKELLKCASYHKELEIQCNYFTEMIDCYIQNKICYNFVTNSIIGLKYCKERNYTIIEFNSTREFYNILSEPEIDTIKSIIRSRSTERSTILQACKVLVNFKGIRLREAVNITRNIQNDMILIEKLKNQLLKK